MLSLAVLTVQPHSLFLRFICLDPALLQKDLGLLVKLQTTEQGMLENVHFEAVISSIGSEALNPLQCMGWFRPGKNYPTKKCQVRDFPGGAVVKNPPAKAGDT
ncbi:hypothetical protein J1605_013309, partial [Eschrichtius robustus]